LHNPYGWSVLLRDVLEFEILRNAGLRVVVEADLNQPVRWVHTGEIADIAQYLRGGEVLLTAATGLGTTSEARRRYISELAEAGAAAVIIELGRAFRKLPRDMVDEANARQLVLAEVEDVPFVEVTQQVHTALLKEQHEAQERATSIGDDFARLVLDGEPVPVLLELLAERLHNPVVLEDGSRHVVAFGSYQQPIGPLLRSWHGHSRQGHQGGSVGVQIADSEPRCAWSSIVLRGEIWGRLHVLEVDTPLDDVSGLALGRVASNIALHLMAERDAYLSETAERSLVGEVVRGVKFSGEDFLARATGLGVDFERDLVMLVVGPVAQIADGTTSGVDEPTVRDALRSARWPSLAGVIGGRVAVVASAGPPLGLAASLEAFAHALGTHDPSYHVGVSRPARATMLHRAFTEAQTAHRLGPTTGGDVIHHYDDLVLHRLLTPLLLAGPELANFVESELGDLITYDDENRSELMPTLDAYLQANGSKAATAEALFLQRRSVYYRLTRIEEILGRSIETPDHRVRLYLALRARELLDSRAATPV
jgi:purine catabolism regulator